MKSDLKHITSSSGPLVILGQPLDASQSCSGQLTRIVPGTQGIFVKSPKEGGTTSFQDLQKPTKLRLTNKPSLRLKKMTNKSYRQGMAEANSANMIAFQIRNLREKHNLTQAQLAKKLSTRQSAIARIEDPDYGKCSLALLHKIGAIFDVALNVEFVSFVTLLKRTSDLSPAAITPNGYEEDFCKVSGDIFCTVNTEFDNSVIDSGNYQLPVMGVDSFSVLYAGDTKTFLTAK